MSIGLSALLAPHKSEKFLSENFPKKPFVVHGLSESITPLTSLPFLQSLESMLNSWSGTIQAHLPDVSDEVSAITVNAADAKKAFNNKMALLFNNVQEISPELTKWLTTLGCELGLPSSTYARCMVYATPDGRGNAAHFDENINFIIQLYGTKKWTLAHNRHVENPTQRYTVGQAVDPELNSYVHHQLPDSMPIDHREEITLKPGSMLFVPRGYWHSTEASGEALSLNFTFSQPTWVDLFTAALRSRLLLSPEWRDLADGVTSQNAQKRKAAEQTFDQLLAGLIDDLPNWRAADVLGATEGEFTSE